MKLFPLITLATDRPPRLDEVTFHIASDTGAFSVGWKTAAGTTQWLNTAGAVVGLLTSFVTYLGGTVVPSTPKAINFTASANEATKYGITVAGLVVTLSNTDAVGTLYEFSALASLVAPNFTLTPNGGKTISGPGPVYAQASLNIGTQGFWRVVEKEPDGNWKMGGL